MAYRARSVSSIFANIEKLVTEYAPRSGPALLGARWSFALPSFESRSRLCEYSFPEGPTPYVEALAARIGVRIVEHTGAQANELYHHLERGEPGIVVIDSFFLPYRPAFNRVHSHRTIIVKRGERREEVLVEDAWPPSYRGVLAIADLDRARFSPVPLDLRLEPIYAGRPINGEWYSVSLTLAPINDLAVWSAGLLQTLYLEATTATTDSQGEYGLAALRRFCEELKPNLMQPHDRRVDYMREASLLLRSELSSRFYLCALLRASANWIGDARLHEAERSYYTSLRHMEMARDVLIKSLAGSHPEYVKLILNSLAQSVIAEERLASCLATYAVPVVVC